MAGMGKYVRITADKCVGFMYVQYRARTETDDRGGQYGALRRQVLVYTHFNLITSQGGTATAKWERHKLGCEPNDLVFGESLRGD